MCELNELKYDMEAERLKLGYTDASEIDIYVLIKRYVHHNSYNHSDSKRLVASRVKYPHVLGDIIITHIIPIVFELIVHSYKHEITGQCF